MQEIWKDIPGYEGIYQASTFGRIRTCEGKKTYSVLHGERTWRQRILKPKSCSDYSRIGYRVTLWKDKKPRDYLVARLVCTTFHENLIDTNMTVNHKDGNRLNNNVDNLEWLSLADNIRHGYENDLYKQNKTTLISQDTGEVFVFRSQSEAAKFLGRNHGYINNIISKNREFATAKDGGKYNYRTENNNHHAEPGG